MPEIPGKPISKFEVVIKQEVEDTMFLGGTDLNSNTPKELQNIRIRLAELFSNGVNLTSATPLNVDEPHTREGAFASVVDKNILNFKSLRSRDGFLRITSDPDEIYFDIDWSKCEPKDVHDGKEGYIILRGQGAPDYYFPDSKVTDYIVYYDTGTQKFSYGPAEDAGSPGGGGAYTAGLGLQLNNTEFSLSHLGIQNLTDPGSHAFVGWNTGTQVTQWYTLGNGISIVNGAVTIGLSGIINQFAPGSVIFAGVNGELAQDNEAFYWDNTNDYLGRRTTSPQAPLHFVHSNQATPPSTLSGRLPMAIFENAAGTEDESWVSMIGGNTGRAGLTFGDDNHHSSGVLEYSNQSNSFTFYVERSSAASDRMMQITSTGVGVNLGNLALFPTQSLDIGANMRLRGDFYDNANSPGSNGQVLKKVNDDVIWAPETGAGGSGTNFTITDGTTNQAVGDAESITFEAGTGLSVAVASLRKVTYSLDSTLTDLSDIGDPPATGNYILQAASGKNYSWIATPGGGNTTLTFSANMGTDQVLDLGDTLALEGIGGIETTASTDKIEISLSANITNLDDVPSYGSGSTALVLTAQNGNLTWAASGATYTGFTFSADGNGTPGSDIINSGDNMEFIFAAGVSGVFGGTSSNPELSVSLKNSGNFTAGYLPVWDSTNAQYKNSIIKEAGNIATVAGYLTVNNGVNINNGNLLRLWNTNDAYNVTLSASPLMAGSVGYVLPATDGSANQVLSTDGSGNMFWQTASGGGITNVYNSVAVSGTNTNNQTYAASGGDTLEFVAQGPMHLTLSQGAGTFADKISVDWQHLGLEDLVDPGADRIAFFDDSANKFSWLQLGTGLNISGTTLNVSNANQNLFATISGDTGSLTAGSPTAALNIIGSTYVNTSLSGSTLRVSLSDNIFNGPVNYNIVSIKTDTGNAVQNSSTSDANQTRDINVSGSDRAGVQIGLAKSGPLIIGSLYVQLNSVNGVPNDASGTDANPFAGLSGDGELVIDIRSTDEVYDTWDDGSIPEQVIGWAWVYCYQNASGVALQAGNEIVYQVMLRRRYDTGIVMYPLAQYKAGTIAAGTPPTTTGNFAVETSLDGSPASTMFGNGALRPIDVGQGAIIVGNLQYHSRQWVY